ncbi:chitobiase/beta-hexosaminidase C-terminal domain-containing protein [Paenarthrobacter aurescens]|uniref:chitobiase/beta-hexosaminidase C-terminal domain-containing protein n=1 Tax=Paenarthrobacter aurescens TaxID=43663 RepID=UPI0021BEDE7F|nr:chitobiase/beta-hexosaminidase C-terminal domain-containing protein [Paenarthrobacter aurescens]MCT9868568.1 chitobiase/beta-hexosaminidase C-terminal domain-containing protein [Paenarthrobacter aurescens]
MVVDRPKYVSRPFRQNNRRSLSKRLLGLFVAPALVWGGFVLGSASPAAAADPPCAGTGGAMQIVAHTDDDLLFLSPDFMRDIQAKRCVQTVFATAGEAGEGATYWRSLESGIQASYAKMAGVSNSWTTSDAGVPGRPLTMRTLNGAPNVSVVYMRLPDGFPNGLGSAAYNSQSILKLWDGRLSSIRPVDNAATFTKTQFQNALNRLVANFQPTTFRTQDWTGNFNSPYDHSDHWATAKFAQLATRSYTGPHTSLAYDAYVIDEYAQNVTGAELTAKVDTFVRFADFDMYVCSSPGEGCPDSPYDEWLKRQYITAIEWVGNAAKSAGTTVTASSQKATAQGPEKVRDGYQWGAPMDATREWVSAGEKAGSWIQYNFSPTRTISAVTLSDRPLLTDQITAGNLQFSDGSTVPVPSLPNNGSGLTINFPAKTVSSVRLNITSVSSGTTNAGLAEFEAYLGTDNVAPVVTAAPPGGTYAVGQAITLTANETSTIYYTTNGSTPTTASSKYTAPLTLSGPLTLKYFAVDSANNSSAVATQTYSTGPDVTKPVVTANPVGGQYAPGTTITLTANEPADIRYTTDGTDPLTAGLPYTTAIPFNGPGPMTLKYFARDTAGNVSEVATQTYTVPPDTAAPTVTANPTSRALASGATIALSANEPAAIYYTTNGSTPTATESPTNIRYNAANPIVMGSSTLVLKYIGVDTAGNTSAVGTQTYTVPAAGPPSAHDYNGDGRADVLAADTAGNLYLYPGNGAGGLLPRQIALPAPAWSTITDTITPGDFNKDGKPDLLARAGDILWFYPGDGAGSFGARQQVSTGWSTMTQLFSPGDFSGDGIPDFIGRRSNGELRLYEGNGTGGQRAPYTVGWGWDVMNAIFSTGDFNGDGKGDVLARRADTGALWLYPGNGSGGWLQWTQIGTGWGTRTAMAGPRDLDGDGKNDVVGRIGDTLWLYPGSGGGALTNVPPTSLGTGWQAMKIIA